MLLGVFFGCSTAVAQAPDKKTKDIEAKGWFVNGQHLYKDGRYRDALVAFEAAYRLSGRANILRSIAYCHENLGELTEALSVLRLYLGLAEEQKIPDIRLHIRRIQEKLEPEDPVPVAADPQPNPKPEPSSPHSRKKWKVSTGPAIGYGLGGAALITGGIFGLQALSARSEADELCTTGDAVFCPTKAAQALNDDMAYSLFADISFGIGGAAVIGSTVWMIVENKKSTGVKIVPFGNGIGMMGRF